MSAQLIMLPKMGAPLRVMTAAQIEAEQKLFLETGYNVSHRARHLGLKRSTLQHHRVPVMGSRQRITPRVLSLIDAGDALLAIASKDAASWEPRLAWAKAKTAITRRKTDRK